MKFKAGDLLFKSGKSLIPTIIKLLTLSRWSHVVVCINSEWCLEATHGEKVRVVPIETFLSNNKSDFSVKRYYGPRIDEKLSKDVIEAFVGKEYEDKIVDLLGAAFNVFNDHEEDARDVFCSELTAYYLQNVGVLKSDKFPDEFTPADFAKGKVELVDGCMFGRLEKL